LTDVEFRRLRHPITETDRLKKFVRAFKNNDFIKAGQMLNETMKSLQNDYEVSCLELDLMHEIANNQKGCFGSRVTGGGFGGAIIALVDKKYTDDFMASVKEGYDSNNKVKKVGVVSKVWEAESGDGLHIEKL